MRQRAYHHRVYQWGTLLLVGMFLFNTWGMIAEAARSPRRNARTEKAAVAETTRIVGAEQDSEAVKSILVMLDELMAASNAHNLEGVLKHYSPHFISGDNLALNEVRKLIEETWQTYPDIHYKTQTIEIRINGDWATVESLDEASANVNSKKDVVTDVGRLESRSRGMIYLRRIGNTWEITSDYTMYERAVILYGEAEEMNVSFSAPDQVFAGEAFTAKVNVDIPSGMMVIASISKDPLIYPQREPEDKFRSLSQRSPILERVFEANSANNNEIVTATIGLTQVGQDADDRPTVQFRGIATIVKRINVVPRSDKALTEQGDVVKYSANGTIDLRKSKPQE